MKNLIIIGARGWGREVYMLYTVCKQAGLIHCNIKGFLDSKADALVGYEGYPPIIGDVENYVIEDGDVFFCAMGDPKWRKHYVELIKSKGGSFISLIHPTAFIGKNVKYGEGCFIGCNAELTCDITLGNFVSVFSCAAIGHDGYVDDYSHLGAHAFMGGFAHLGKNVVLHPAAKVLPHIKIGDNAVVGAGSVVIRNVKSEKTVFGIPAKKLEL